MVLYARWRMKLVRYAPYYAYHLFSFQAYSTHLRSLLNSSDAATGSCYQISLSIVSADTIWSPGLCFLRPGNCSTSWPRVPKGSGGIPTCSPWGLALSCLDRPQLGLLRAFPRTDGSTTQIGKRLHSAHSIGPYAACTADVSRYTAWYIRFFPRELMFRCRLIWQVRLEDVVAIPALRSEPLAVLVEPCPTAIYTVCRRAYATMPGFAISGAVVYKVTVSTWTSALLPTKLYPHLRSVKFHPAA